ncbi:MAG: LysM peptidoglycan-binding domain-containing protein, partial [Proteobacteria bacterium]|nr:LysM peptidoglycan-binding domain-containing protein [Pseudomonadota bacterium]
KKKGSEGPDSTKRLSASLLKKNEFALILFGALLITIMIFFLFFRSSGSKTESVKPGALNTSFTELEKRIELLEQTLQNHEGSIKSEDEKTTKSLTGVDIVKDRVTRLETAFSVKFDSLSERMGNIEKSIAQLKGKPVAAVIPKPASKPVTPEKKAIKKEKKASMFHTVQKGETLYSISKKYNTSISALRKLNNLSTDAKIYPGNNILIR